MTPSITRALATFATLALLLAPPAWGQRTPARQATSVSSKTTSPKSAATPRKTTTKSVAAKKPAAKPSKKPAAKKVAAKPTTKAAPAKAQRAIAQSADISAPITDVNYTVSFNAASARNRTMRVAMEFRVTGSGPVLLSLPAWTPGAYELSFFSRWVTNFGAQADGKPLQWEKVDYDTWRIQRGNGRSVRVTFDYVADTLDNAMSWSRPDFLLFNGTNVFLYAEGRSLDFPATVHIETEPTWLIATGMKAGARPRTYTAPNYHDLVDMPFFVGQFELDSAQFADRWMRFATYPVGSVSRSERANMWQQFRRTIPPQAAVFGEIPWETYTVLQIADSSYPGIAGLEHQNSHVDITHPTAIGDLLLASINSHEFFHAWNVKRLRPAELWPYRYDRAQPTTWLWMSEGVTDYYGDLALLRSGIVDSATFLRLTESKVLEVSAVPPIAPEDASLNTWVEPVDGTEAIYYAKGSLAGFLLDIMIRDASNNRSSLDDVMRALYRDTYKRGNGFTGEQWWRAVSSAAGGKSFDSFRDRYIDGREPFPMAQVLPLAGLKFDVDTIREPRLGVTTAQDSLGVIVLDVDPGSSSAAAGVRPGDYLLAVGTVPVEDQNFGDRFRATYVNKGNIPLPLRVRRGTETLTLNASLRTTMRFVSHIRVDTAATAKAVRVRGGIFRGVTEGPRR